MRRNLDPFLVAQLNTSEFQDQHLNKGERNMLARLLMRYIRSDKCDSVPNKSDLRNFGFEIYGGGRNWHMDLVWYYEAGSDREYETVVKGEEMSRCEMAMRGLLWVVKKIRF